MDISFIKLFVFSGPMLVFVIWQLVSVSRELREPEEPSDDRGG